MENKNYIKKYIDFLMDGFKLRFINIPQILSFIVIPIYSIYISGDKWLIVSLGITFYYLVFFIISFLIYRYTSIMRDKVLRGILPIRTRLQELKGEEFGKRNVIEGMQINKLKKIIKVEKIPSKAMLNFWLYELNNTKAKLQITFPKALRLMVLSSYLLVIIIGNALARYHQISFEIYEKFSDIIQTNTIIAWGLLGSVILASLRLVFYDSEMQAINEEINLVNLIISIADLRKIPL